MTPSPAAAALEPLAVHRYRARFRLREPLHLPGDRLGVTLRGALGLTLRRLVCHDLALDCARCELRASCAYPALFDPGARDDAPAIRRLADPPRPFVIRTATPSLDAMEAGEALPVDLHIVGNAHGEAGVLLAAFQSLAEAGLGPRRVGLSLEAVEALDARGVRCGVALDAEGGRLAAIAPRLAARDLERPGDSGARSVRLRFVTPTLLKEGGEEVRVPRFGVLARRLRARLGALATVFGEGALGDDPREIAAAADEIRAVSHQTLWRGGMRRSTRTGQRHPLEGLVGEAVFEGELGRFMPMLRLGELLHVGKHATFGLGRVEVEVLG